MAPVVDIREDIAAFNAIHGIRRIRHPYSRVDIARNRIVQKFMEITSHPESSITMLDTDHLHRPSIVRELIENNLPVVGALAFRRGEPYDPQIYVNDAAGELLQPTEWPPGVLEGDIVGAAALCIRRKVFVELEEKGFHYPWFRMMYTDNDPALLGEDWYFGTICKQAGIKHYCDMRIISPHHEDMWIDEKPWLIRQGQIQISDKDKKRPEPWFQDSFVGSDIDRRWAELKGRHSGETCLIIGNGPSLKDIPLDFLKKYVSFGTNRIYRLPEFEPHYYACVNPLVLDQFGSEMIQAYKGKVRRFFLSEHFIEQNTSLAAQPAVIPLHSLYDRAFFTDPTKGLYEGHTVTFVCLQLAYWMDFQTALLVGVDHRYTHPGMPNEELVSDRDDPNHFDPDYFGKGTRWNAPDLVHSTEAYQMAKKAYEDVGRNIVNLTPNSALEVFEKQTWQAW